MVWRLASLQPSETLSDGEREPGSRAQKGIGWALFLQTSPRLSYTKTDNSSDTLWVLGGQQYGFWVSALFVHSVNIENNSVKFLFPFLLLTKVLYAPSFHWTFHLALNPLRYAYSKKISRLYTVSVYTYIYIPDLLYVIHNPIQSQESTVIHHPSIASLHVDSVLIWIEPHWTH